MTTQTTGLSALEALGSPFTIPTVIRIDDTDAVVLTVTGPDEVQLWTGDGVTSYAGSTVVEPVTDPVRTESVLRQAIASLNTLRREALETTLSLAEQHAATLAVVRDYAVEAYRDGDICEDGLNEFLRTFDLGEYEPYVGLNYTMAGSLTVAGADEATVRSTVAPALTPDLAAVRWVRDGSADHQVSIQAIRPVSTVDGRTVFEVDFIITGEYEVDSSDTDDAEADCRCNLRPDLADIPAVFLSSLSFTIEDVNSDLGY